MTDIRTYDSSRDFAAIKRIWREVGWFTGKDNEETALELFLDGVATWVGQIGKSVESSVSVVRGALRYLKDDLSFAGITGVTTSRVARHRGITSKLVAHAIAHAAVDSAAVCGLGMFEQGYYNRFGFGTGTYEHTFTFDPNMLTVTGTPRFPIRISPDDWERVYASRIARRRVHGSCTIESASLTHGEMLWTKNGFGLGYTDSSGNITHHLWMGTDDPAHGPYSIWWLIYRIGDEFLELLRIIKSLGDQVHTVRMAEPPGIQVQDFIRQPFRLRQLTRGGKFELRANASAYWQARILDLNECIAAVRTQGSEVEFNLDLVDPIAEFLPPDAPWHGIGGKYVIHLGQESTVRTGNNAMLPTLHASVGAFTRLWLGVLPATGLEISDNLAGPVKLIAALDEAFRLPAPHFDWDF